YNKKERLYDYNTVILLVHHALHNIGLYRRICHCFSKVPYGILGLEMYSQCKSVENNLNEQAKFLGVPESLLPLDKPFENGVDTRKIDSWKSYYENRNIPLDSPLALILEYPLTIFHLLNKFVLPKGALPSKFVIHLVGVEKEADLIPLFQVLMPLFPKMNLFIHMIGPAIPSQLEEQHRIFSYENTTLKSKLTITLTSSAYDLTHLQGNNGMLKLVPEDCRKPDVIMGLNSGLMAGPSWYVIFLK
ncbi:hypothetical protein HK099_000968, partial [Clydaea vesicula]